MNQRNRPPFVPMLEDDNPLSCWRAVLLVVAFAAAFEGFADLDGPGAVVAKTIFVLFTVLFLVTVFGGVLRRLGESLRRNRPGAPLRRRAG